MKQAKIAFAVVRVVFNLITMAHGYQTSDALIPNPPKREYSAVSIYQGVKQS